VRVMIGAEGMALVQSVVDNVFFYVILVIMSLALVIYGRIKNWVETQRIIRTFELIAPRDDKEI